MALRRIEKKKEKRKKVLMGVVLSILMVMSGFGIFLSGNQGTNSIKEHGKTFTVDQTLQQYTTKIDGKEVAFYYLPSSLLYLAPSESLKSIIEPSSALIVTFSPNASQTNLQIIDIIRADLTQSLDKPLIHGVSEQNVQYNLPEVQCQNATVQAPVVHFKEGTQTSITIQNACITLQGNQTGLLELRDYLLYDYYGIYEE